MLSAKRCPFQNHTFVTSPDINKGQNMKYQDASEGSILQGTLIIGCRCVIHTGTITSRWSFQGNSIGKAASGQHLVLKRETILIWPLRRLKRWRFQIQAASNWIAAIRIIAMSVAMPTLFATDLEAISVAISWAHANV